MVRITFLLIVFLLFVLIVFFTIKINIANKNGQKSTKTTHKKNINKSISDELLKLQNLREEDIISEEEFEKLKKDLIK